MPGRKAARLHVRGGAASAPEVLGVRVWSSCRVSVVAELRAGRPFSVSRECAGPGWRPEPGRSGLGASRPGVRGKCFRQAGAAARRGEMFSLSSSVQPQVSGLPPARRRNPGPTRQRAAPDSVWLGTGSSLASARQSPRGIPAGGAARLCARVGAGRAEGLRVPGPPVLVSAPALPPGAIPEPANPNARRRVHSQLLGSRAIQFQVPAQY